MTNTIRWDRDADGIVVLTLDDPNQSANTMNADFTASFEAVIDRLESERDSITGVVVTSAKKTFFAGGDLHDLLKVTRDQAAETTAWIDTIKSLLRRLETLGRPVVAAINGAALGGGLEIALATHHRIAADVRGSQIGLPEVTLGLLPGAGGVVRTTRMFGVEKAIRDVLVRGQRYAPGQAKEIGLIDELVGSIEDLLPRATAWIKAHPEAMQPWDVAGYRIPGSDSFSRQAAPALLRQQTKGAPLPAPRAILATAIESTDVDFETATKIETRYFISIVTGQVAKNMTKAFFLDMNRINAGGSRPAGIEKYAARKVGVLGAGMMGAGIAYVTAKAGIDVVLKDVTQANAEKGKQYAVRLEQKAVAQGQRTQAEADALLARITPTADAADLAGVDFVIEAVFESPELKAQVFGEIEPIVDPDAVLGSNTSTLPITGLAHGVQRPEDFIGIHFFSPVDKMALVEIVRGEKTSDETLAKAFDYVRQIKKTPIVVNDSRGFFTSRVIAAFIHEAVAAVGEGVEPASVEQAALQAGYPAPALQLSDELTLTLLRKIREENRAAVEAAGGEWTPHGADAVMDRMIDEYDRQGRSSGAGFYEYVEGRRTRLWPGLREAFHGGSAQIPLKDLSERMLFAEALETVRCFEEGVLNTVEDANIGSLLGIGYPAWTGGVIQFINQYDAGTPGFVGRARQLADRYGDRFLPPQSLVEAAAANSAWSPEQ